MIPIHRIAAGLANAPNASSARTGGIRPRLIPLVEVVQSAQTSHATVAATMELLTSVGKSPAHVAKDVPGFVANRLQHALWREAIAMVAEGICDAATLDACVKNSFGLRLAVLGPLENADLVGLDLTLDIHRTIIPELDRLDRPEPLSGGSRWRRAGWDSSPASAFEPGRRRKWTTCASALTAHLLQAQRNAPSMKSAPPTGVAPRDLHRRGPVAGFRPRRHRSLPHHHHVSRDRA